MKEHLVIFRCYFQRTRVRTSQMSSVFDDTSSSSEREPLRRSDPGGPVAQWIRHRSTEPEIVGSSPTRVILFSKSIHFVKIHEYLTAFDFIQSPCGVMDNALDF